MHGVILVCRCQHPRLERTPLTRLLGRAACSTRYSLGVYYRCAYTSSTSTYSSGSLGGSLYGSHNGNDPNDVAAAGAVVWLFILGCVVGTWVGVFLCMKCCIDQRPAARPRTARFANSRLAPLL